MENIIGNVTNEQYLSPLHEAAVRYATMGFQVFPMFPKGDVPAVIWDSKATGDVNVINQWWTKNENYNVGIVTGKKSGVVVIRFKTPEVFEKAQERGLTLAPIAKTEKGFDLYCKYKDGLADIFDHEVLEEIILFEEGQRVMVPPSVWADKPASPIYQPEVYSWYEGKSLADVPPADIPQWILKADLNQSVPDTADPIVVADVGKQDEKYEVEQVMVINEQDTDVSEERPVHARVVSATEDDPRKDFPKENKPTPATNDWKTPRLFDKYYVEDISADQLPSWLGDYSSR